jgi:cytoskeletal protein RodZ
MTFLHKRVEEGNGTFGSHLRDLRELQKLTLERASKDTKIRDTILAALEEDRIGELDDPVFAERHLMAYVRYLGGHEPYFLARYRERLKDLNATHEVKDLLPRTRGVRWRDLFVGPQVLAAAGVLFLGVAFGGYVMWQAHLVGSAPSLDVTTPQDGEHLERPTVDVQGVTMSEATVTINGKNAPVDGNGAFILPIDVRRGTTIIKIVARRRRGSETVIERRVVYDAALSETDIPEMTTTTKHP